MGMEHLPSDMKPFADTIDDDIHMQLASIQTNISYQALASAAVAFVSYNPSPLILNMVDGSEFFSDSSAFLCNMAGERIGALRIKAMGRVRCRWGR